MGIKGKGGKPAHKNQKMSGTGGKPAVKGQTPTKVGIVAKKT